MAKTADRCSEQRPQFASAAIFHKWKWPSSFLKMSRSSQIVHRRQTTLSAECTRPEVNLRSYSLDAQKRAVVAFAGGSG